MFPNEEEERPEDPQEKQSQMLAGEGLPAPCLSVVRGGPVPSDAGQLGTGLRSSGLFLQVKQQLAPPPGVQGQALTPQTPASACRRHQTAAAPAPSSLC